MQILAWLAVLLGLRSQSQSRSAMTAICLIAAWVLVSAFFCRPGGFVFEAVSRTGMFVMQADDRRGPEQVLSLRELRSQTIAAAICCMIRPDGGMQANEAVLISAGNPYVERTELYFAPSQSIASALTVSAVVFVWQLLLLLLIRTITLRWAPRLLGRYDQEPDYRPLEAPIFTLPSVMGSEVTA
jgi:hypothetical protein